MATTKTSLPVWLRRLSQTVFLLMFFYLFCITVYHPENATGGPVTFFFNLDPLVMITLWLGGHAVAAALLLSLITLVVTLVFGRWFCGWVCPFGALNNLFSAMAGKRRRAKDRVTAGSYSVWQKSKYYVLVGVLVAALFGVNLAGWVDPFSFLYRSMATAVFPAINAGLQNFFDLAYETPFAVVTEPVYHGLRKYFMTLAQPRFFWGSLIGVIFGAIVLLNFFRARFWCRYVCPTGALLGFFGKNPTLQIEVDADKCNNCMTCVMECQGGADPSSSDSWKPSECFYCWSCHSSCPQDAISFNFSSHWAAKFFKSPEERRINLGRRQVLTAGAVGLGSGLLLRTHPLADAKTNNPALIRPPGAAAENDFLEKCIRCGECMKVCPTNAIQPAMLESGLEGLWSPVIRMQAGYCEYKCTMCTQVCPTQAIRPLPLPEKQTVKIGLAYVDKNRCLPYAYDKACQVCEQHCPLPEKAIRMEQKTVTNAKGTQVTVRVPHVDATLCIGCGICQNKCPVPDQAAIRITSAGESRNPQNQFLGADRYSG
jgi:MauM/NapG family ferredoxin protein